MNESQPCFEIWESGGAALEAHVRSCQSCAAQRLTDAMLTRHFRLPPPAVRAPDLTRAGSRWASVLWTAAAAALTGFLTADVLAKVQASTTVLLVCSSAVALAGFCRWLSTAPAE